MFCSAWRLTRQPLPRWHTVFISLIVLPIAPLGARDFIAHQGAFASIQRDGIMFKGAFGVVTYPGFINLSVNSSSQMKKAWRFECRGLLETITGGILSVP
jgi:hypothetical protein